MQSTSSSSGNTLIAAAPAPSQEPARAAARPKRSSRDRWAAGFLTPLLLVLLATGVIPLVYTLASSLGLSSSASSPGDMNYTELLASAEFQNAIWVQIVFVVGAVVIEIILGTGIALLLNRDGRVTTFIRTVGLAPILMPTIVVALIASFMLQSNVGIISAMLKPFGIDQTWLASGPSALAVLIGVDVWQYTPFVAILILAGLQGIPEETIEAATVDGASRFQITTRVVLPQLAPTMVATAILRFIDAIQVFPTIYVLTNGGPGNATNALNFWGFTEYFKMGHKQAGAASAVILTIATICLALIVTRLTRKSKSPQG